MKSIGIVLWVWTFLYAQSPRSVNNLFWLSGDWEMVKGTTRIDEVWLPPAGTMMMGMSRTLRNGIAVEYEFMTIDQDSSGDIFFRARPSRQIGASFRMTKGDSCSAQFENNGHDFPQRIIYTRISGDSLVARIEGIINAKKRSVDFHYRKKR